MIRQHRKLLKDAYRLEQHVCDTLQMNVGNLSLKESRRSLEKANSPGRIVSSAVTIHFEQIVMSRGIHQLIIATPKITIIFFGAARESHLSPPPPMQFQFTFVYSQPQF